VIAPNGVVAIYGSSAPETSIPFQFLLQYSIDLKFFLVYQMPLQLRAQATTEITRMLERGELMRNVAQTFALADIAAAHEAVESGKGDGQRGGQPRLAHLLALRADFCAEPQQARVDFLAMKAPEKGSRRRAKTRSWTAPQWGHFRGFFRAAPSLEISKKTVTYSLSLWAVRPPLFVSNQARFAHHFRD